MTVESDASGRRSVHVEVEVEGTPEEVWRAIATGPGVTSWFVPTEIEERVGGAITCHFAPGMDTKATITAWEPPYRMVADSDTRPGAPTIATEWLVESRSGGTCVVRVVHSLFATSEDWDGQLEGTVSGWQGFFRILSLYMSDFRGEPCSPMQFMGSASGTIEEAWKQLMGQLGIDGAAAGMTLAPNPDVPSLSGVVDRAGVGDYQQVVILRIDEPAPGIAFANAMPARGAVFLNIVFYLYGEAARDAAAREQPNWHAWISEHFPFPAPAAGATPTA